MAKKVEKDREKEQRRQERMARRRAMPNHKFDDPVYEKQRELLSENQDDALQKGTSLAITRRQNFRLVQIEANCRQHFKLHLK